MSKVITKLRCYSPSLYNTPKGNVKHLYYIADRTNAVKDEFGSSTFGYINYNKINDSIDKNNIAKHIRKISEEKNNVYRGIISLKEEDSIRLGYDDRSKWENMIKNCIRDIAKVVDVPFSRLEYVGVVHMKKGNPHLHYMFWDKEQGINDCFITTYQQNEIRDVVIKTIYKEELQELYKEKDELKKHIKSRDLLYDMKAINLNNCNAKIPYIKMKKADKKELLKMFKTISKELPRKR